MNKKPAIGVFCLIKRLIISLFVCFILTACAGHTVISAQGKYTIIPESPRPGEPVTIGSDTAIKEALIIVNGKQVTKAAGFSIPAERRQPGFLAAIITSLQLLRYLKMENPPKTVYIILSGF